MIAMYDLEDNYIMQFKDYKECAEYFKTNPKCIYSYISKSQKGIVNKKWDDNDKRHVRLFKIEDDEE